MARAYHKSWQSDRPMKRTTRRVRWFEGDGSIRLAFDDQYGRVNVFFTEKEAAQRVYEAFIAGEYDCWNNKPKAEAS